MSNGCETKGENVENDQIFPVKLGGGSLMLWSRSLPEYIVKVHGIKKVILHFKKSMSQKPHRMIRREKIFFFFLSFSFSSEEIYLVFRLSPLTCNIKQHYVVTYSEKRSFRIFTEQIYVFGIVLTHFPFQSGAPVGPSSYLLPALQGCLQEERMRTAVGLGREIKQPSSSSQKQRRERSKV